MDRRQLDDVVERELRLLDPGVRRDGDGVLALLHPDFVEHGSSGRRWDAAGVARSLADADDEPTVTADDVQAAPLAPDVVLVTYRATSAGRTSLRASVWVRTQDRGWLLRFHQGTPVPPTG
ncbi:nuclear transport factor 2 family protein [Thalassiella azotivora]